MFREIIRSNNQILREEQALSLLKKGSSGVLSLLGDEDYTYGVPISYAYADNKLYFHSAKKGHKIDAIKRHDRVSFTVIETDNVVPEEFTTYYRSVIVFGRIRLAGTQEEIHTALDLLVEKYSPDYTEEGQIEIKNGIDRVHIIVLDIEHISGKEASELAEIQPVSE